MSEFNEKYRQRSHCFAISIVKLCSTFPKSMEYYIIGKQLLRCGTSVAANFRASCRARSEKEYFAKLCIVVEECDESLFWLELLRDSDLVDPKSIVNYINEATELTKIFASTRKSLRLKLSSK